jgi:uncharacterized repeat protein (TIGR01451 family)
MALAAALLLAPFTPITSAIALAHATKHQQDDVPPDVEQAMFTKGQNLYNSGRYDQAVTVLNGFLKTYPNSIITDLTLLWLGRSYMQLGKIQDAEQVGQRLRSIKDTPFADIYEGELQTARRENPARNSTATAATNPPVTRPTPPAGRGNSRNPNRPVENPPTTVAANRTPTTSGPQPRLINTPPANTNTEAASSETNPTAVQRRGGNRPRRIPAETTARATQTPVQNTLQNPVERRPTSTELAVNNSPRTSAPVERPAVTTPTPVRTNPNPPVRNTSVTSSPGVEGAPTENTGSQTGGLSLTVKQVPNLSLALRRAAESATPGQAVQLPLTVTNTGNKEDQFRIETDLPAEYQPTFSLAQGGSDSGLPIYVTPQLARNASVDVILNMRVPETAADGQQRRFFVRAASQSDYSILKVADGSINVVAAALAASSNVSETSVMPGENFTQTISIKNNGSSPANSSRADFVFNPNFELVSASPAPIAYDRPSRTAIWSLGELGSHASRDITVTLRALPDALAATNSLGRGTVRTQSLPVGSNFDSPSITVGKIPKARIDAISVGLTATPGDTIYVPFVVRNPGNTADAYELRITAPNAPPATIYADTNGDGQHQDGEAAITQTSQLDPQGGQYSMLLRAQIPGNTPDRQQYSYNIVARSLTSNRVASEANTVLTIATPRVRVRTEQVTDASAPGDTIFYRLVLVNEGSGLAKNLAVTESLPDALQFVNSDPSLNAQDAPGDTHRFVWRVNELAPGDTAVLKIAVRLRANLSADVNLTTRHTLSYQDTNNNAYQGQ